MPLLADSTYRAPPGLGGGHTQTLLAHVLRRPPAVVYRRERIDTPDGDFLDLDWHAGGRERLAIISYGMEGSSQGDYVRSLVHALAGAGWDALVWNYRGCGGEPNRKVHFYHGGLIEALEVVLRHALAAGRYRRAMLAGFSLGGNLTLNYLGRRGDAVPAQVTHAVAVSAPVDVTDCARQLRRPANRLYVRRFLRLFRERVRAKMKRMPGAIDDTPFRNIHTLDDYDAAYTAPHFGFPDVPALYQFVSPCRHLSAIRRPTLILNARNDPFLGPGCFPIEQADRHPWLSLEMPGSGGHLGFLAWPVRDARWLDRRILQFVQEQ